jgi:hypothetical protein
VSLPAFQRAFCDLIASPDLCIRLRASPDEVLAGYDLSPRERRRILGIARQRGMSVNCTLYRVNRVTPLYTLLPRTCSLLGERLAEELEAFWRQSETDLQYGPELERFARFLRGRVASGELVSPLLAEMLEFELAWNSLRYVPRRAILADIESAAARGAEAGVRVNPLVRVVRFAHDPVAVLRLVADGAGGEQAGELEPGEHYLLLDATTPQIELRPLEPRLARALRQVEAGRTTRYDSGAATLLREAGLLVAGSP